MNAPRGIVPAIIVLAVLLGAALLIAILVPREEPRQEAALTDDGPNAGLSNAELVSVAITNMKALKSYHFDFKGGAPGMGVRMSSNLSITADVQLYGRGARWKVRDEGGGVFGKGMGYDVGDGIDGIRATADHWYESYDGGKTWILPESGDTQLSFLLLWLDCRWGDLFEERASTGDPNLCEAMARYVDYNDGTPRLEKIDGTVTRHMSGVYSDAQAQASGEAVTVDVWVSTDITPTLRQMRIQGSNKLYENIVEGVNEVAISPDGKTLASAHGRGLDATVRLYGVDSPGDAQRKLEVAGYSVDSVDFSPDGTLLAGTGPIRAATWIQGIYIWDMTKPDSAPITRTLPADVYRVRFQPGGKMLAAGSQGAIYLIDPRNPEAAPTVLPVPKGDNVRGMAFSGDGRTLVAATFVWDDATGRFLIYDVQHPEKAPIQIEIEDSADHIALSPDGTLLAAARSGIGGNPSVDVWDLRQPASLMVTLQGKSGDNPAAEFSPDGKYLALLGEEDRVEMWEVAKLKEPSATRTPIKLDTGNAFMTDVVFSSDGTLLVASTDDGSVLLWKMGYVLDGQGSKPQVFGDEQKLIDKPFSLTWTWSRFNEDFGVIKPPPTVTTR